MNWTDPVAVRAYKAGYMRANRRIRSIRKGATRLAQKVMMNEIEREAMHVTLDHRVRTLRQGNAEWQQLGARI